MRELLSRDRAHELVDSAMFHTDGSRMAVALRFRFDGPVDHVIVHVRAKTQSYLTQPTVQLGRGSVGVSVFPFVSPFTGDSYYSAEHGMLSIEELGSSGAYSRFRLYNSEGSIGDGEFVIPLYIYKSAAATTLDAEVSVAVVGATASDDVPQSTPVQVEIVQTQPFEAEVAAHIVADPLPVQVVP
jgi:hypothetical protein